MCSENVEPGLIGSEEHLPMLPIVCQWLNKITGTCSRWKLYQSLKAMRPVANVFTPSDMKLKALFKVKRVGRSSSWVRGWNSILSIGYARPRA
jgi:hypothetical protein